MSYVAIIGAAIASIVIGGLWYGPMFGKKFQQLMGMDQWSPERQAEEKKKMTKLYVMQLVASLIMFYVLNLFIDRTGSIGVSEGVTTAFWIWLGFVVPLQFGNAIWGGKMQLFYIGAGNMLVTMLAAGAIIGALN